MSVQIITGGCKGTDAAAMYWADRYHIPFRCILPSFHSMQYDLRDDPFAPWHIGMGVSTGIHLFRRREHVNDTLFSVLLPLTDHQSLRDRFEVAPEVDVEAAAACRDLNTNFDQYYISSRKYLQRDHTIATACDRVLAFGYLTPDDDDGGTSFVRGGTGWTVRLAQRLYKPVHLYDLTNERWLWYDYDQGRFVPAPAAPKLEGKCAIVGDRHVDPSHNAYDVIHDLFHLHQHRRQLQAS